VVDRQRLQMCCMEKQLLQSAGKQRDLQLLRTEREYYARATAAKDRELVTLQSICISCSCS
jgi:hypothetical protein